MFIKILALRLWLRFVHLEGALLRKWAALQERERQAVEHAVELAREAEEYKLFECIEISS